jgi:hypothetical protein
MGTLPKYPLVYLGQHCFHPPLKAWCQLQIPWNTFLIFHQKQAGGLSIALGYHERAQSNLCKYSSELEFTEMTVPHLRKVISPHA